MNVNGRFLALFPALLTLLMDWFAATYVDIFEQIKFDLIWFDSLRHDDVSGDSVDIVMCVFFVNLCR